MSTSKNTENSTKKYTYEYWRENVMDERLEYLEANEKYSLYILWKSDIINNTRTNK